MGLGSDVYLVDDSGTPFGVKRQGNLLRVETTDRMYNVGEGNIDGYSSLYKFGYNAAVGTTYETVWSASNVYTYLTSAEKLQTSGGANDTGAVLESGTADTDSTDLILKDSSATFTTNSVAAGDIVVFDTLGKFGYVGSVDSETQLTLLHEVNGLGTVISGAYRVAESTSTGAAVVNLQGLDGSYDEIQEFVVLNGATDVVCTKDFLRINRVQVIHAGSTGSNVGVIDIQNNAAATTHAQIRATIGQTEMCTWTVPRGKNFYMVQFNASEANNKRTRFTIYHRNPGGIFRPIGPDIMVVNNTASIKFNIPLRFDDKEDIEIRAIGEVTGGIGAASWEGWYEDE